jgi:hypothetical protein
VIELQGAEVGDCAAEAGQRSGAAAGCQFRRAIPTIDVAAEDGPRIDDKAVIDGICLELYRVSTPACRDDRAGVSERPTSGTDIADVDAACGRDPAAG